MKNDKMIRFMTFTENSPAVHDVTDWQKMLENKDKTLVKNLKH